MKSTILGAVFCCVAGAAFSGSLPKDSIHMDHMRGLNHADESTWFDVNKNRKSSLSFNGDVLSPQGGEIILSFAPGVRKEVWGGVGQVIRGDIFKDKTITLSADYHKSELDSAVYLWVRADNNFKRLEYAASPRAVSSGTKIGQISVSLDCPVSTKAIWIGVAFNGSEKLYLNNLRLKIDRDQMNLNALPTLVLNAAVKIVMKNSYYLSNIPSDVLTKLRSVRLDGDSGADAYESIRFLLSSLHDGHSFLLTRLEREKQIGTFSTASAVDVRLLKNGIGYIRIPGMEGEGEGAGRVVSRALKLIQHVSKKVRNGWVIDLRNDTGGNMWPMLQILEPFLHGEKIGSFVTRAGEVSPWNISVKKYPIDGEAGALRDLSSERVAVLIGNKTNSAGEAVAISFMGRAKTKFFGSQTSGRSTANKLFALPDGGGIALVVAVDADRFGRRYEHGIRPDLLVSDKKSIGAAIAYLNGHGGV